MSFQQKNITVSLVNFTLILGFFLIRLFQFIQDGTFESTKYFAFGDTSSSWRSS
jgi:hypothetical protein